MAVCPKLVPLLMPMTTPQNTQQASQNQDEDETTTPEETIPESGSSDVGVSVEKLLSKMKGCVDTYASRLK